MIDDETLALALIDRLNQLVSDPAVRADIERLIAQRVPCSSTTAEHPTIQVCGETQTLGLLGLLNGLCGTIAGGKRDGWGRIAACYEENRGPLLRFCHSESTEPA
jgi:hypothetical protein